MQEGRLRAVVSVTVDDELAIHDIKVIEGPERLFVAMPSRKEVNGIFRDIAHPISPAARHQFEDAILNAYQHEVEAQSLMGSCTPIRPVDKDEVDVQKFCCNLENVLPF